MEKRKRERFCFHQRVGGELGGRQEEDGDETLTTLFLPFALPPGLNSNAKERCQGAAFLSFLSLAASGLGFSVGAPHLVGIRLQKESRVGCEAVGVET